MGRIWTLRKAFKTLREKQLPTNDDISATCSRWTAGRTNSTLVVCPGAVQDVFHSNGTMKLASKRGQIVDASDANPDTTLLSMHLIKAQSCSIFEHVCL